ncbi:sigma factor-like helix-turn-helix DNA-binding protein [Mycoplasma elephantis]|uniref:sigma factor-like helix-turn-helix DNA-binding protein n=1 Tax=Mycoplasma elephantis TaxID=114882 RepID=UPI00048A3EA8|nr:sigma factor-like helix-turn-helix DNA-binding protein [Mycoplasma elephantis]
MDLNERTKLLELWDKYKNFLTEKQQLIFELYLINDLTYGEIGKELGTTRANAYDAIKKAKQKLLEINEKLNKE